MSDLEKMPNIGKTLAKKLNAIGIHTGVDIKTIDCEGTVVKLVTIYKECVCVNMIYAIEGAIQSIRWHELDEKRKNELKIFLKIVMES